jgi:DNA-binding transcriptional MerR regulator
MTMREMSARSGVSEATLRMWELRHGFPEPRRRSSGHRRYSELDLARVRAVVRARESGLSLRAAIELASGGDEEQPSSVYAALRARVPGLEPQLVPKPGLLAMSRAIEDESMARAQRPLLFGCFQREQFYRQSQERWRELARTAERAVVLAEFRRVRRPRQAPLEVPIRASEPVAREWVIVCESPGFAACLAGWERPHDSPAQRAFEAIWTVEAPAVRLAAQVCWQLPGCSPTCASGSTTPRWRASTSSDRRLSSAPGWSPTPSTHSPAIPAASSACPQWRQSASRSACESGDAPRW